MYFCTHHIFVHYSNATKVILLNHQIEIKWITILRNWKNCAKSACNVTDREGSDEDCGM